MQLEQTERGDGERQASGREQLAQGIGPILGALFATTLIALTLMAAILLGSEEQRLIAGLPPTAIIPAATPSPIPATAVLIAETTASPTLSPAPALGTIEGSPPASAFPTTGASPTATSRPLPTAVATCPAPSGWRLYVVQRGDTLRTVALRFSTTDYTLMWANCLTSVALRHGQRIYVPGAPARAYCGHPAGWVLYAIRWGDTLYSLACQFGVSVAQLKQANCLVGDTIYAGARLWVPYIPYTPPTATRRPTASPVPTRTPTATPSATPSPTPIGTVSATPEPTGSVAPETPTGVPTEPTAGTVAPTEPPATELPPGTVAPTEPPSTEAPPTTEPLPSEPPPTQPPATQPPATEPPPTQPPPTQPPPTATPAATPVP